MNEMVENLFVYRQVIRDEKVLFSIFFTCIIFPFENFKEANYIVKERKFLH